MKATSFLLRSSKSFIVADTIFLFEYYSISEMSSKDVVSSMMLEFDEDLRKKAKTLSNQHTSESIIFFYSLSEAGKKKTMDGGIMYSNGECQMFF